MANKSATNKKPAVAKSTRRPVVDKLELSPSTPIPFEGGRGFTFVDTTEYLPFLSDNDGYAQLLLEARLLSDTNNACITTKRDYCAGSGFQYTNSEKKLSKKIKDWLKVMNRKNETSTEINKKLFESHFTWGNTPVELVRFSLLGKKRLFVYVHNFLEWRLCAPNSEDEVTEAIQSKLFLKTDYRLTEDDWKKVKKLPIYNPLLPDRKNWKKGEDGTERTLIWYKNPVSGFNHYGLPSNVASLIYQVLEFKGARFNLDNFDNNMVVSAILALKGNLSQTEANRIGKKAIAAHTGDGKRGRVMVVASEEGIDGSDLHNLQTHKEASYTDADEIWVQKIILANAWDSVLAGILSASTMGKGTGFLAKILEIKQKTVIKPAQRDLLEKVWIPIFDIANKWLDLGIDSDIDSIEIKNSTDISALTDVDITPAVKVDEVRDAKGLSKLGGKKGEQLLGEVKGNQMKGVYVKQNSSKKNNGKDVQPE